MSIKPKALAMVVTVLAMAVLAHAQGDLTWTNDAGTGLWNTDQANANWSDGSEMLAWPEIVAGVDGTDQIGLERMPDNAIFTPAMIGEVMIDQPVMVGGLSFDGDGHVLYVTAQEKVRREGDYDGDGIVGEQTEYYYEHVGFDFYGPVNIAPATSVMPRFVVSGTMAASGAAGGFVGIEDLVEARYTSKAAIPWLRLDNSNEVEGQGSPVNENRWGDNTAMTLNTGLAALELTAGPAHEGDEPSGQDITEHIGQLNFGGVVTAFIQVDRYDPNPMDDPNWDEAWAGTVGLHVYEPDFQTTMTFSSLNRLDQGVLMLSGHSPFNVEQLAYEKQLGNEHRILVRDAKPQLLVGEAFTQGDETVQHTMVAPYIIDGRRGTFLTYDDGSSDGEENGFMWSKASFLVADTSQPGQIVTNWDFGTTNDRNIFTQDRTVMAIRSYTHLDPEYTGAGDYKTPIEGWSLGSETLTITSGGFISLGGLQDVNVNIVAGQSETAKTELIVSAFAASTNFRGTITANGLTVASMRNGPTLGQVTVRFGADNTDLLTGPISILQEDGYSTHFDHPRAPGVGNDLTIGGGRVDLDAAGETYAFGNIDIWSGSLNVLQATLTTTTSADEVRELILAGKIMSTNAGPIDQDGPELVMAYKEIDLEGQDLIQAGLALMGDANMDGIVDVSDLGILAGNWKTDTDTHWFTGDFNLDGIVDVSDLGILAGNWKTDITTDELAPMLETVPEPASLGLLAIGGLTVFRFRRKR